MTPEEFKTMVLVKLELLRGCCQVSTINKKQIAKSIEDFIKKVEEIPVKTIGERKK